MATLVNRSGKYLTDRKGFNDFKREVERIMAARKNGDLTLSAMEEMLAQLNTQATVAVEDPAAVQARIIGNILSKESVDEVLAAGAAGLPSGRDLAGEPLILEAVNWNASDFHENDSSLPIYAVVSAVHAGTGERSDFSCGSTTGVAQLYKFAQLDAFPVKAAVALGRRNAAGNQPYWFAAAGFPA